MAQTLTEESANKQHNVKARAEAIRDAMKELYSLDNDIEELLGEHIKPLREEKREIKSKLTDGYELSKRAFNAVYGQYRLEQKARDAEDNTMLDTLRELYKAMPIGGQVNMDDVMQDGGANGAAGQA